MNARDATLDDVRAGAILAGRYLVERRLGEGGMGVVVSARHLQLGHRVAIKFLTPTALENAEAVERFRREAWAAAQIKSPHVVQVSEVANLPNGMPFIVMEYLEGEDLADLMERQGRLPVEAATGLMLQVCEAIAEAHAIGVVHRDLKPSNIFCARDRAGQVVTKVLDFGVSKLTGGGLSDLSITTTRMALGSPLYMSPEQMQSAKTVDERTDMWSIGVILYELLTAAHPFEAESLPDLAIKVSSSVPTPLRDRNSDVPRGLERVVLRCLEKAREKRFEDVGALARALAPYASESARQHAVRAEALVRVSTPPAGQPSQPPLRVVDGGPTLILPKPGLRRARIRRWSIPLAALTLVALAAWAAASWASRGGATQTPNAATSTAPAPAIAASAPTVTARQPDLRTSVEASVSSPPTPPASPAPTPPDHSGPSAQPAVSRAPRYSPNARPSVRASKPPTLKLGTAAPETATEPARSKRSPPGAPNALVLETQELGGRL